MAVSADLKRHTKEKNNYCYFFNISLETDTRYVSSSNGVVIKIRRKNEITSGSQMDLKALQVVNRRCFDSLIS